MAARLRLDGVETYLGLQLDDQASVIQFTDALTMDGGIAVPSFTEDQYLTLSILDANFRLAEIIHLVEYTQGATSGTISRAQEGTLRRVHPVGSKVVHAPTVDDFLMVQDHDSDPHAHSDHVTAIATGLIDAAILAHREESSVPHDYYAKSHSPVFTGDVVIDSTATFSVQGTMRVESTGTLIVNGDLIVAGRIIINGHELFIDNDPPPVGTQNMVWIETFG